MKDKGQNALEIVFTMFILIVVTLVIIKLFMGIVNPKVVPNIDDFKDAYNYANEKNKCDQKCSDFTGGGCIDLSAAVMYCQRKIAISIDGNSIPSEKLHGGFVAGAPYCEDGLYCFHITDCGCGTFYLTPEHCMTIMEDFYQNKLGWPEETADHAITDKMSPGTCDVDTANWGKVCEDCKPLPLPTDVCQKYYDTDECFVTADYWWRKAGYWELFKKIEETESASVIPSFFFSCGKVGTSIRCSWFGCPITGDVMIFLNDGSFYKDTNKPLGTFTFGPMEAGSYSAVLTCGGKTSTFGPVLVE